MLNIKKFFQKIKISHLPIVGILVLLLLAAFLLWFNNSRFNSTQAQGATAALVDFDGEYCFNDGEWHSIEQGKHIPSTKGDVTLRINFYLKNPQNGNLMNDREYVVPIAFYTDHIGLTFYSGDKIVRVIDNENPEIGAPACGENWTMHPVKTSAAEPTVIVVHNPHNFGNENAIDTMLSSIGIWANMDFEKEILNSGEPQRNAGMLLMLVSIVFLGIALFASLIHIKSSRLIWLLGLVVLFAGAYFAYSAGGVSFWSESIASNTTVLGCSMMFYMLFLSMSVSCFLKETKKIAKPTVIFLAVANAVFFILPIITAVFFYDVWVWWVAAQLLANIVLLLCLIKDFIGNGAKERWLYVGLTLPLVAFAVDAVGTWLGAWKGGIASQYVFIVLFAIAVVMVLKFIPNNINAATKAKELEMEKIVLNAALAESRISTMMSQIRPHFIYNTLGSIEQLCKLDPPKAGDLVHNFAKYLRGNFGELDNPKPILMSQEMEHVHHYISIENVRFPDMTFTFEMNSDDFHIPALTVQPIVENAIKHGLMKLPRGGTIRVMAYETDAAYCVSVVDDGVGFDVGTLLDDRKHMGLRNIRERLKVMVKGTLDIESTPGVGTKVLITIPKEAQE
jgi:hypothetical protein